MWTKHDRDNRNKSQVSEAEGGNLAKYSKSFPWWFSHRYRHLGNDFHIPMNMMLKCQSENSSLWVGQDATEFVQVKNLEICSFFWFNICTKTLHEQCRRNIQQLEDLWNLLFSVWELEVPPSHWNQGKWMKDSCRLDQRVPWSTSFPGEPGFPGSPGLPSSPFSPASPPSPWNRPPERWWTNQWGKLVQGKTQPFWSWTSDLGSWFATDPRKSLKKKWAHQDEWV